MSQLIPKSTQLIIDNFCGRCGIQLLQQDNFCRHCGTPAHGIQAHSPELIDPATVSIVGPAPTTLTPTDHNDWQYPTTAIANRNQESSTANALETVLNNRFYVSCAVALLGPLGLPALWFSPRFSKPAKIIVTLIFIIITTILPLLVVWYFVDYSIRPLVDVLAK